MRRHALGGVLLCALAACGTHDDVFWIAGDVQLGSKHEQLLGSSLLAFAGTPGIVNLEGPIAEGASYEYQGSRIVLRNRLEAPRILQRSGVRVAGLANNHALDLGADGRARTQRLLRDADIRVASETARAELRIAGRRVVVGAFDLGGGVPPELSGALRSLAQQKTLAVALFHTAGPPSYLPVPALRQAVELALGAGVRVIAAHGSHAIARVERRGGALIAWGLGNLAFDCPCSAEDEALVLKVRIGADGALSGEAIPIRVGRAGNPATAAPHAAELIALLNGLGSPKLQLTGLSARF